MIIKTRASIFAIVLFCKLQLPITEVKSISEASTNKNIW